MSYRLVKGAFVTVGSQPDGDSVHFRPDNPDLLKNLPVGTNKKGDARISTKGESQLRMEGVDALELHFTTIADHQEINAARRARDVLLLTLLGFGEVQFNPNETATSSVPPAVPGYILTNGLDNLQNRRAVAFLFVGTHSRPDGANVFVKAADARRSANAGLLKTGEAYPLYYNTLPVSLRDALARLAVDARSAGKGLWPADRSLKGIRAKSKTDLQKFVFFPKLYRRLKDFFVKTGATDLSGFDAWVRADPDRDDTVWIGPMRELGSLHNTYKATRTSIKMLQKPEDLIFVTKG